MIIKFIFIGFAYTLGDVFMKTWSNQQYALSGLGLVVFIASMLSYMTGFVYYGLQLRTTNFGIATLLPIVINVLIILLLTIFYYHEPLTLKQWVGASLGILAVILLR
jgi:drug/metabolite transporter (DMT)-like permease